MAETFGRYELLKRLGGGGMGEVFLARQKGLEGFEKLLVVKTLHPHLAGDPEFKSMFLDEARLAAQLTHPNIAQIFDLGEVEGTLYMAMEYIAGDDLKEIGEAARAKGKPFPPALVARAVADAAAGLHVAHTATDHSGRPLGIIHRDVSPHNILITYDGGVKVIDFGVAKAAGRMTKTQTGALKGKFAYMSPEQVNAQELDARSDVFALGIVLWEALAGRQLFKADNEMMTLMLVAAAEVEPPSKVNPAVPSTLDAVALKALAKERDQRHGSAQALRLALEDWISESRAGASNAHLAAYIQEVYAEKYEKHRTQGPLADIPPADAPVRSVRPARAGDTKTVAPDQTKALAAAPPVPVRSRLVPLAVGAAVVVAAGLYMVTRPGQTPAPASVEASPARPAVATLQIRTVPPGAALAINGEPAPQGVAKELPPGEVQVKAAADGYLPASRSYTLLPGQSIVDTIELKRTPAMIGITSDPPGAAVTVNGEPAGVTPTSAPIERGMPAQIAVKLRGYHDEAREVTPAGDQEVAFKLRKVEKRVAAPAPEIKMSR